MIPMDKMKKLISMVSTFLMLFVFLMMIFFVRHGVKFMFYSSIPAAASYIFFYYLIYKEKWRLYVWLLYAVITFYMVAATVCMGYNSGFHLYCLSLVSVSFYLDYLAHIMHTPKVHARWMSLILVIVYLASMGYVIRHGSIYEIDAAVISRCMYMNAIAVFCFLIGYSSFIHKTILESEDKLSVMAHMDQLTGLYNRRYMMEHLEGLTETVTPDHWIAMVDIDDFKQINDVYGHSCGDYVLSELCGTMRDVCGEGCTLARWGGEEFLITSSDTNAIASEILEKLRRSIELKYFSFQHKKVPVTITIGAAHYQEGQSLDSWIQSADKKLYIGKNGGKNRMII